MYKKISLIVIAWVLFIVGMSVLVNTRFNLAPDTAYNWQDPNLQQVKSFDPAVVLTRWDAIHFKDVAENGYKYTPGTLSNIVFFPVFPLLVKFLMLFGSTFFYSALVINIISLIFAAKYIYKICKEFHPGINPYVALAFGGVFPTAVFFVAPYSESIFLALSAISIYHFKKHNFGRGGIFGLLASLSRMNGVFLGIIGLFEFWKYSTKNESKVKPLEFVHKNLRKFDYKKLLLVAMVGLGPFLIFAYHQIRFGDFGAFFNVQKAWGRQLFHVNYSHFLALTSASLANLFLDLIFVVAAAFLVVYTYKRVDKSYGLYAGLSILFPLLSGTSMSIGRYMLPLFPLWIAFAHIKSRAFQVATIYISTILMTMYLILYTSGHWAG